MALLTLLLPFVRRFQAAFLLYRLEKLLTFFTRMIEYEAVVSQQTGMDCLTAPTGILIQKMAIQSVIPSEAESELEATAHVDEHATQLKTLRESMIHLIPVATKVLIKFEPVLQLRSHLPNLDWNGPNLFRTFNHYRKHSYKQWRDFLDSNVSQ